MADAQALTYRDLMDADPPKPEQQIESPYTEGDVIKILASKHRKDLFVAHCKTGSTWYGGCPTLDAWVMPYSWTKPIIGYEVKVSRSDYKRDKKWRSYLMFCNLFFFVTPWEMIRPEEVPPEAGLIWVTKTGSGIRYKKPGLPNWHHQIPQTIFQYVLMWRHDFLPERTAPKEESDE